MKTTIYSGLLCSQSRDNKLVNPRVLTTLLMTTLLTACGGGGNSVSVADEQKSNAPTTVAATDPSDRDNDGTHNLLDAFPDDPAEQFDTDADGIGNNRDTDDDNDGVLDTLDAFPVNPRDHSDNDGDGIGDNKDIDDDNDGVYDHIDQFPLDASQKFDQDGDGIGDTKDPDIDGDGVSNEEDIAPWDPTESVSREGDQDLDGVGDEQDAAPLNPDCAAENEMLAGVCIITLRNSPTKIEIGGNGIVYLWNNDANAIFVYDQLNDSWQDPVIFDESLGNIRSIEYSNNHQRLYLSFDNDGVLFLDSVTLQPVDFFQSSNPINVITEAGRFLLLNNYHLVDESGNEIKKVTTVHPRSGYRDSLYWDDNSDTLVFVNFQNKLQSVTIDQQTGAIGDRLDSGYQPDYPTSGPLRVTSDGNYTLFDNGSIYSTSDLQPYGKIRTDYVDIGGANNNELIVLKTNGEQSQLVRYNSNLQPAETVSIEGTPIRLIKLDDHYRVLARVDNGYKSIPYRISQDSDNDTVPNSIDAFPADVSASIDTDLDGAPDSWNPGYSQADSTSNLSLDAYPDDPACSAASEGNGQFCDYELSLPAYKPDEILTGNDTVIYLFYSEDSIIYRWDTTARTFIKPFKVGRITADGIQPPKQIIQSNNANRLYLRYSDQNITYIDTSNTSLDEVDWMKIDKQSFSITDTGTTIRLSYAELGYIKSIYINHSGETVGDVDSVFATSIAGSAWDNITNRFYFFETHSSVLNTIQLNGEGYEQSRLSSAANNPIEARDLKLPILISPDGEQVVTGNGDIYSANNLERSNSSRYDFEVGTWMKNGTLAVAKRTYNGGEIEFYTSPFLQPVKTIGIDTMPVALVESNDHLISFNYHTTYGLEIEVHDGAN